MTTPILHHYPTSLFSEKIRTLFGYLKLEWQSVIIPHIMPRPHLMPLSGGYRKTPIMQIGANIYCDTEIICRKLANLAGDTTLYAHGFVAEQVARWADTELFRTTVAMNFRPEAVSAQMSRLSQAEIEAFQKDRAELSKDAPIVAVDPAAAEADFRAVLENLDTSLTAPFLFGPTPSIADFSLYHCLWFVAGNAANAPVLNNWSKAAAFFDRMKSFGHGTSSEFTPESALSLGKRSAPIAPEDAVVDALFACNFKKGDRVTVAPNDYGKVPVAGNLVSWTRNEIIILREDEQAGSIMVHFPNTGFEVMAV